MNKKHKRVLIVGTIPYNKQTSSRAFESYFSNWESENLAQIFSHPKEPVHGHCNTFFQITDKSMLLRHIKKIDTGKIFYDKDLSYEWKKEKNDNGKKSVISKLYGIGSKKNSIIYLLRGALWKKKYWCTEKLNLWLDEFKPECVFLAFSDDYFIPRIALYVAERYDIPIISCIGDDYYFNTKKTISPFYYWYKYTYKKLIDNVFKHGGSAAYIGNKIRDKYNKEFGLNGKTVYLTSELKRHEFRKIDIVNPLITYCGNIRLGRNESLCVIAEQLKKINPNYTIDVYSNETEKEYYSVFDNYSNINYHGAVPYSKVKKIMYDTDIALVVEGFKKKDVDITRYSLSTKVADSLTVGAAVFALGSIECGAIEYLKHIDCCSVCLDQQEVYQALKKLVYDEDYQLKNYRLSNQIIQENHTLQRSNKIFESIVDEAVLNYKRKNI